MNEPRISDEESTHVPIPHDVWVQLTALGVGDFKTMQAPHPYKPSCIICYWSFTRAASLGADEATYGGRAEATTWIPETITGRTLEERVEMTWVILHRQMIQVAQRLAQVAESLR